MQNIRVASVQFEHTNGNKQANLDKVTQFAHEAAEDGQYQAEVTDYYVNFHNGFFT